MSLLPTLVFFLTWTKRLLMRLDSLRSSQDYFENTRDGRVTWTPQRLDSDLMDLSNQADPSKIQVEEDDDKNQSSLETTNFEKFVNFFDLSRINLSRDGTVQERVKVGRFESSPL